MLNQPNRHNESTQLIGLIAQGFEQSVKFPGDPGVLESSQSKSQAPDYAGRVSLASRLRFLLELLQAKTRTWA